MEYFFWEVERKRLKKKPCPHGTRGLINRKECRDCDYHQNYLKTLYKEVFEKKLKIEVDKGLIIGTLQEKNRFKGNHDIEHFYIFTGKTCGEFAALLKECDDDKIERFINDLEGIVGDSIRGKRSLNSQPNFHLPEMEKTIKALRLAEERLSKISSGHTKPLCRPKDYISVFEDPDDPLLVDYHHAINDVCRAKSKVVLKVIPSLIQNLEFAVSLQKRKRGEHVCSPDGLAFQIACLFEKYIGLPQSFGGPYPKIVNRCFEICGMDHREGRRRTIDRALKKLSRSHLAK